MKLSLESIHADLASILVCAFFGWGPGHLNADEPRPNILFILADDMGWQDTSVPFAKVRSKWNDRFRTPALERLAREGTKFTQAYSCAVCSPTRVSFLTGRNQARHGVTQWTYLSGDSPTSDLKHPTLSFAPWNWNGLQPEGTQLPHAFTGPVLPELLKQAGYRTMHFGKGHFGAAGTPGADPQVFGFDVRIGGREAGGCGSYWGTKNFGAKNHPDGPWRAWDLDQYFGQDIHLTEALTLTAMGAVTWQATAPVDIAGTWKGENWRTVSLSSVDEATGWYNGTFTDDEGHRGAIQLEWSRVQRRYNGRWKSGDDRSGSITLRAGEKEQVRGAGSADPESPIRTNRPRLREFTWRRTDTKADAAKEQLAALKASAENLQTVYVRKSEDLKYGQVSREELQTAEAKLKSTKAKVAAAEASVQAATNEVRIKEKDRNAKEARAQIDIDDAEASANNAYTSLIGAEDALGIAQSNVITAEKHVSEIQQKLKRVERLNILATQDGYITSLGVNPGRLVNQGDVMCLFWPDQAESPKQERKPESATNNEKR